MCFINVVVAKRYFTPIDVCAGKVTKFPADRLRHIRIGCADMPQSCVDMLQCSKLSYVT